MKPSHLKVEQCEGKVEQNFFLVFKEYKTNRGTRILSGDPISINSTMSNDSVIGEGEGS